MDVPQGTIAEVLDWVDEDPDRAEHALAAEFQGQNRSTLINQLEAIIDKEDPVSDEPEAVEETGEAPGPEQPSGEDLTVDLADRATVLGPRNQRTPDIDIPEDNYDAQVADAADEPVPVDAQAVDFFQLASSGGIVVLRFDDAAVLLDAQQALALQRDLRQALANATY